MTWCVNNEHPGDGELEFLGFIQTSSLSLESLLFEEGGTNLLCNTSGFALLNVGLTNFVEQFRFSSIDVTHNDDDWTTQIVPCSCCQISLFLFFTFSLPLLSLLLDKEGLAIGFLFFRHELGAFFSFDTFLLGLLESELSKSFFLLFLFKLYQILNLIFIFDCNLLHPLFQFVELAFVVGIFVPFIT